MKGCRRNWNFVEMLRCISINSPKMFIKKFLTFFYKGTMIHIMIQWFRMTAVSDEHKHNLSNHIITKTCEPHVRFFKLV